MRIVPVAAVCLFVSIAASATTIIMPTDAQLIAKATLVVEGEVLTSNVVERGGALWTETLLRVDRTIKGDAAGTVVIREAGGATRERITKVFGAPEYREGERVLAFLVPTPRGAYQTVDLFAGKFTAARTLSGQRLWKRNDAQQNVAVLDTMLEPAPARNLQRDAAGFEEYIGERVAGRAGVRNYHVENPIVVPEPGRGLRLSPDFTLIAEPTIYRWSNFDTGGSAAWHSSGTQPGYSGGGVNEARTGMAAWTNYASAKIRYTYAGVSSKPPAGGGPRNSVNEILFNDPLDEISGTFIGSGVVGQGGFNGVMDGGQWTSPFAVGAEYPKQTFQSWRIVEGFLMIQDGVTPSSGVTSNRLAEILAHEFGHTLGFGHSAEGTALMAPTLAGIGPQLREDDQLAARWLYPNGTTPPPPTPQAPSAPSSLMASVSGTSATLQWNDNSSNESGFAIYVAAGSGAFSRIAEVAAGQTTAVVSGFAAGTYRIYVAAYNSTGESMGSNTVTVTFSAPGPGLTAWFTASTFNAMVNQSINFTDQTTGGPTSWQWSFGDGTFSSVQHPSKRYLTAGTFTVSLTAYGAGGNSSSTTRIVAVSAQVPSTPQVTAGFDFSPGQPRTGEGVTFADRSTGGVTSWVWSFGDGASSGAQNPVHTYSVPGTYTVSLTAYNGQASATASRTLSVTGSVQPFRSLVPVTAQLSGAGGFVWRTELTLFNAGSDAVNAQLVFIPAGGGAALSRSVYLGSQQSVTWANALAELFGLSTGSGAITVESIHPLFTPKIKVSSRTFTNDSLGTYGQSVPDVSVAEMEQTLYLTGLRSDNAFRTNVGLVNRSGSPVEATLTLLDENSVVATASVNVPGMNFQQSTLASLFPAVAGRTFGILSMRAEVTADDVLSVYASVVDNRTQDPVYIHGTSQPRGTSNIIAVAGRTAGANATFWRTDVAMHNPLPLSQRVTLRLLPDGTARSMEISAGATVLVSDVIIWLGLTSGSGALEVSWSGVVGPVVTTRTYTTVASGGTYGQSIEPIAAMGRDMHVPGLRSDASFRTNVGFVNGGSQPINVAVTLLSWTGQTIGETSVAVAAMSQVQYSIPSLFPGLDVSAIGTFTLKAEASAPTLFAYGSIVDNASGDPVFFAGE